MTDHNQPEVQARYLLQSQLYGVLSTHSKDMPDYPFGSLVPYCLNSQGQVIILISTIAQHTRNISINNKVSLLCHSHDSHDIQTVARVTYLADAEPLDDEDAAARYFRYFPKAKAYDQTHDFSFYQLNLKRIRYIGGFGDIHWFEPESFIRKNPFSAADESHMIEHMNNDHADAIKHYCDLYDIDFLAELPPELVGIDGEGFDLRCGDSIHRILFKQPVDSTLAVRQALVELAKTTSL